MANNTIGPLRIHAKDAFAADVQCYINGAKHRDVLEASEQGWAVVVTRDDTGAVAPPTDGVTIPTHTIRGVVEFTATTRAAADHYRIPMEAPDDH